MALLVGVMALLVGVMAVLVAIHANMARKIALKEAGFDAIRESSRLRRGVDARDKRGHDVVVNLNSRPCGALSQSIRPRYLIIRAKKSARKMGLYRLCRPFA